MALNFLGALGAVGRMLPGYMQGERQAVADNWNDLDKYNQVQAGQLQNLFTEATMDPRLQMFNYALQNADAQTLVNAMRTGEYAAGHTGRMQAARNYSQYLPNIASGTGAAELYKAMLEALGPGGIPPVSPGILQNFPAWRQAQPSYNWPSWGPQMGAPMYTWGPSYDWPAWGWGANGGGYTWGPSHMGGTPPQNSRVPGLPAILRGY